MPDAPPRHLVYPAIYAPSWLLNTDPGLLAFAERNEEAEELSPEEKSEIEKSPTLEEPPSPLLKAQIAYCRNPTPEAKAELEAEEARLARIHHHEMPDGDRRRLIEEMRADGWTDCLSAHPDVLRRWRYVKWTISPDPGQRVLLGLFEGKTLVAYLRHLYVQWLERHPELLPEILADLAELAPILVLAARRIDPKHVGAWLFRKILEPVVLQEVPGERLQELHAHPFHCGAAKELKAAASQHGLGISVAYLFDPAHVKRAAERALVRVASSVNTQLAKTGKDSTGIIRALMQDELGYRPLNTEYQPSLRGYILERVGAEYRTLSPEDLLDASLGGGLNEVGRVVAADLHDQFRKLKRRRKYERLTVEFFVEGADEEGHQDEQGGDETLEALTAAAKSRGKHTVESGRFPRAIGWRETKRLAQAHELMEGLGEPLA
jgi:hypothetical protein